MTYSLHSNLHHLVMNNAREKDTFLLNGQDIIYLLLSIPREKKRIQDETTTFVMSI